MGSSKNVTIEEMQKKNIWKKSTRNVKYTL